MNCVKNGNANNRKWHGRTECAPTEMFRFNYVAGTYAHTYVISDGAMWASPPTAGYSRGIFDIGRTPKGRPYRNVPVTIQSCASERKQAELNSPSPLSALLTSPHTVGSHLRR